jgi:hypothetical protein
MSTKEDRKRRQLEIGLANNATGAVAGTLATVGAYRAVRRAEAPSTRAGKWAVRQMSRAKVSPKRALVAAGVGNIALQAGNGLLDAQSAGYFARERAKMGSASKSLGGSMFGQVNGHGVSLVSKAVPVPGTRTVAAMTDDTLRRFQRHSARAAQQAAKPARQAAARRASTPAALRARQDAAVAGPRGGVAAMERGAESAIARNARVARGDRYRAAGVGGKLKMAGQDAWNGSSTRTKAIAGGSLAATAGGAYAFSGRKSSSSPQLDPFTGLAKANYTALLRHAQASGAKGLGGQRTLKYLDLRARNQSVGRAAARSGQGQEARQAASSMRHEADRALADTQEGRYRVPGKFGGGTFPRVSKARRFDPEADRQRRTGLYAGAGLGGAAVAGQQAAHAGAGLLRGPGKKVVGVGFKNVKTRGRAGALVATSAALGTLGVAAYRRGISERNQPWA